MRGLSSGISKSVVGCLAILAGAGVGGLAAGFNVRAGLSPQASSTIVATIAKMAPSDTVNLRFPADWAEASAEPASSMLTLASADPGMTFFNPPASAKPAKPRSNAVLNDSQLAGIKKRLNLTPEQERYWPAVEAELRKMEYTRKSQGNSRTASIDMSKLNVEGLKSAGFPLVMSFSDDQRRELRSLAHLLGLENVMAGL